MPASVVKMMMGDAMKNGCLKIAIVVTLGIILPMIMFMRARENYEEKDAVGQTILGTTIGASDTSNISLAVLMDDGGVETMQLEVYVVGVVLKEMPAEFEQEALKAQAVVARTYALRRFESGGKHQSASVCTDPSCCQAYCSPEDYLDKVGGQGSLDKVEEAVFSTAGEVLVYEGELIEATYFSCSGGMTEDAAAVWGADVPYLQATESPGEEMSEHFVDTVTYTVTEFADLLGIQSDANPSAWIENISYTNGGGVDRITICGQNYKGTFLRKALDLRSTAFTITIVGNTVTITTKGFGHRVGMSQYGAETMALTGKGYIQILQHYYSGTDLVTYCND